MSALLAGTSLTGCSTISAMNPINWWHRQEGGKIAQERPAPPGADAPYPNLATVPARPEPPDQDALKKLTASLIADRTNAQHAAQAAPLADPSSPSTSPSLFGVGTSQPPPPPAVTTTQPKGDGASASIPAVSAPPSPPAPVRPATPPAAAPRKAVQSAPLEAPAAPPADTTASVPAAPNPSPAAAPPAAPPAAASPAAVPAPAPPPAPALTAQPALPPAPPPRPAVAGSPPPPAPTPAPPMPAAGNAGASIVFVAGSSQLLQPAADEVKAFAGKRGNAVISVTGYGDSVSSDPSAQAQAVTLGLARAQAIFAALRADGVPPEAIRVNAEASGRGAALRLLQ